MDQNQTQFRITKEDKVYNIQECVGGVYKQLRMLSLNFSGTDKLAKADIVKEFKLSAPDADSVIAYLEEIKKDEINVEQYYEQLCEVLFMENPKLKFANINLGEVRKATKSFFLNINSN